MITIAMEEGELKKAKDIASRDIFKDDSLIQFQMITIAMEEGFFLREEDDDQQKKTKQKFLDQIKTKLYNDKIEKEDISEIQTTNVLSEEEKMYLLLAIYEKQKKPNEAKQLVRKYKEKKADPKCVKNLNKIMSRLECKKKGIFDMAFYDDLLGWKDDANLKKEYEKEIRKSTKKPSTSVAKDEEPLKNETTKKPSASVVQEKESTKNPSTSVVQQKRKKFGERINVKPENRRGRSIQKN